MDAEEYKENNQFKVEPVSGFSFTLKPLPIGTYDKLMSFMDEKGIEPDNPDSNALRKYPGKFAEIMIPPASISPKVLREGEEIENPKEELKVPDIDTAHAISIMQKLFEKMGSVGEKAREMKNFRGEESPS